MKFIIDNERLPDNFDRFWTVNCLETERKVQNLTGFLIARQERFNVLSCSNKTVAEKYVADILRANKARNFAIRSSFKLFKPHWVFLFDGSQFLTEEGLGTITKVLKTSIPLLHLTPAYRLIYKYAIDWKTKFEEIIDFICEAGDAQIGMNKVAYAILKKWEIFEEDLLYSMDKRQQIWALDTIEAIHCRDLATRLSSNRQFIRKEIEIVERCGYSIRLPFYPNPEAPHNQTKMYRFKEKLKRSALRNLKTKIQEQIMPKYEND
ncbi:uncharacterized protein LOC142335808 [Convolutriloba macropyga]|uniref:uncharacterized protein LOC142335808 n=1 Tax=Convolutriloba macropyga TaxID=536237 RepID=UPI003F525EB0